MLPSLLLASRNWRTTRWAPLRPCRSRVPWINGLAVNQLGASQQPRLDDQLGRNSVIGPPINRFSPALSIPARSTALALAYRGLEPLFDWFFRNPNPV